MFDFIVYSELTQNTATSYISYEEAGLIKENTLLFNCPDFDNMTQEEVQKYLINGTKILDNLINWAGDKQVDTQRLEFPRDFDKSFTISDNIKLATAYISSLLKQNKIETLLVETSNNPQTKKEKVDVLEKEYFEVSAKDSKLIGLDNHPVLKDLLKDYLYREITTLKVCRG